MARGTWSHTEFLVRMEASGRSASKVRASIRPRRRWCQCLLCFCPFVSRRRFWNVLRPRCWTALASLKVRNAWKQDAGPAKSCASWLTELGRAGEW